MQFFLHSKLIYSSSFGTMLLSPDQTFLLLAIIVLCRIRLAFKASEMLCSNVSIINDIEFDNTNGGDESNTCNSSHI